MPDDDVCFREPVDVYVLVSFLEIFGKKHGRILISGGCGSQLMLRRSRACSAFVGVREPECKHVTRDSRRSNVLHRTRY